MVRSGLVRPIAIAAILAAMSVAGASARADDDPDAGEPEPSCSDLYRRASLSPFLERRIELILQDEWRQAQENAEKVGLRRMSRKHYRRALTSLARTADARIRALIGAKKFAAWKRARANETLTTAGDGAAASQRKPAERAGAPGAWPRDRCAALARFLRGAALETMSAEEAHVWIYNHARHC
jgi:hypothetical protein